jgi:hypothetical protein
VSGQAEEWFRKGCSFATGTAGAAKDEREAVKWFRLAADQGHADGQFSLGVCHRDGTGVEKDDREAVKWFRLAADQGHAGQLLLSDVVECDVELSACVIVCVRCREGVKERKLVV